jgi:hypothetical protein
LRPYRKRLVDIFVSDTTLDRALEVASEIFLKLEDRGHRVRFAPEGDVHYRRCEVDEREGGGDRYRTDETWCPSRPTLVFVGAVAFGITLYEVSEEAEIYMIDGRFVRTPNLPKGWKPRYSFDTPSRRHVPSGRLCLRATSPYWSANWERSWTETNAGDLSGMFETIAKMLEKEAPALVDLVAEGERAEQERQRRRAEEEERRREAEAEQRRIAIADQARTELL